MFRSFNKVTYNIRYNRRDFLNEESFNNSALLLLYANDSNKLIC